MEMNKKENSAIANHVLRLGPSVSPAVPPPAQKAKVCERKHLLPKATQKIMITVLDSMKRRDQIWQKA
eukprot:1149339-Pelagomonas_calceolata.AAC.3